MASSQTAVAAHDIIRAVTVKADSLPVITAFCSHQLALDVITNIVDHSLPPPPLVIITRLSLAARATSPRDYGPFAALNMTEVIRLRTGGDDTGALSVPRPRRIHPTVSKRSRSSGTSAGKETPCPHDAGKPKVTKAARRNIATPELYNEGDDGQLSGLTRTYEI